MDIDDIGGSLSVFERDGYLPTTRSTSSAVQQMIDSASVLDVSHMQALLNTWNQNHRTANWDPVPFLTSVAEVLERAHSDFMRLDPDPQDDRHPVRTHPQAPYGNLLKMLFRNDEFMTKLVVSYLLTRDNTNLNIAAARVFLNCVPGLDNTVAFAEPENLLSQLFSWAQSSDSPELSAYSMGLLASAMEVQETASKFRDVNASLIPIALSRLAKLKDKMIEKNIQREEATDRNGSCADGVEVSASDDGPFANIDLEADSSFLRKSAENSSSGDRERAELILTEMRERSNSMSIRVRTPMPRPTTGQSNDGQVSSPPRKRRKSNRCAKEAASTPFHPPPDGQSNSNWHLIQPLLIGKHEIYPLTVEMHQRLILQYLTPTGEYQDLLAKAYEGGALPLILDYLDLKKTRDVRLTFDVTRYVASLLVHRKFAMEFVQNGGIDALLKIPQGCLAAVGVATCLYYLAYSDDVMETLLSQQPERTVDNLVGYALWCVEHSHESGMASACMFFTHGFRFRMILEKFDQKDGLRILFNYLSTLTLMQESSTVDRFDLSLSEEQMHTSTQTVRNACAAFRSYLAAHLYVKLEQLRRAGKAMLPHGYGCTFPTATLSNTPGFRPMMLDEDGMAAGVWTVACAIRTGSREAQWRAADDLRRMNVVKSMFHVVIQAQNWEQASGRLEMARNALEIVWMLSALPKTQIELNNKLQLKNHPNCSVLNHIVDLCTGEDFGCSDIARTALRIIVLCVCTPPMQEPKQSTSATPSKMGSERKVKQVSQPRDVLERMWDAVRKSNGLMALLRVLQVNSPELHDVDRTRSTACKALLGMARDPLVCQILKEVPLIKANELYFLMRENVPSERRAVHAKFCREARKLIEVVTGKPVRNRNDVTQEKLWRQFVVSSTKITYSDTEVLQMIHSYLMRKGLRAAAFELSREAALPLQQTGSVTNRPNKICPFPSRFGSFSRTSLKASLAAEAGPSTHIGGITLSTSISGGACSPPPASQSSHETSLFVTPQRPPPTKGSRESRSLRAKTSTQLENGAAGLSVQPQQSSQTATTLDDIITQYFRVQHWECRNPVAVCPPFSLFRAHRCPESTDTTASPGNVVSRTLRRPLVLHDRRSRLFEQDERFIHSRFRALKSFLEHDEMYTTAAFSIDDEHIVVGMYTGDVHWLNVETSLEESHTQCHHSAITHIQQSTDGSLLLTSSAFMVPFSSLWRLGESQEHLLDFEQEMHVEFANGGPDKVLGTGIPSSHLETVATVFDTETGSSIVKLWCEGETPRYRRNKAHFAPDDSLILHDGRLWDARANTRPVHSFDKLNHFVSGVFHPYGTQVIINSEVWDMRTYKLLHSIPTLDQTELTFTASGSVFYAVTLDREKGGEDASFRDVYSSTFRTFDSSTYQQLACVDVRRPLLGLCVDHKEHQIAVIEKTNDNDDLDDLLNQESSSVKVYEVGKVRAAEEDVDEAEEEAEEPEEMERDDQSGSSTDTFFSDASSQSLSMYSESEDSGSEDDDDDDDDDGQDDEGSESGEDEGWQLAEEGNHGADEAESRSVADGVAIDLNHSAGGAGSEHEEDEDGDEEDEDDDMDDDVELMEAALVDDDDSDSDEPFVPEEQDGRGQGSSSIVLNPTLRRQRRQDQPRGGGSSN